jgi:DNA-3-methyladenine glycosylase
VPSLPHEFYQQSADIVARDLLGQTLVRDVGGTRRRARLIETEAYLGPHDAASHSRVGRTPRNASMFGPAGHAYVYFVYGMHHCLNAVAGHGDGQAVLLRAAQPLDDWDARLSGPALLASAFGVDRRLDGTSLVDGPLRIEAAPPVKEVLQLPRIGVAYAGEWAAKPLRFVAADAAKQTIRRWEGGGRP